MKKEDFCEILGDINEKHIAEAGADYKTKRSTWFKWGIVAACMCLVVAVALVAHRLGGAPGGNIEHPGESKLVVNKVDNVMNTDMDVQFSYYKDLPFPEWETVVAAFKSSIGLDYEDFTAKLPDRCRYEIFYSVDAPADPKRTEYIPTILYLRIKRNRGEK